MKISLVLPGHGPIFTDAELLQHYEERIGYILEHVTREMNAYEVTLALCTIDSSLLDQWIALGETNAYLQYLASIGEICVYKEGKRFKYVRK